jgi:hypothetical protein
LGQTDDPPIVPQPMHHFSTQRSITVLTVPPLRLPCASISISCSNSVYHFPSPPPHAAPCAGLPASGLALAHQTAPHYSHNATNCLVNLKFLLVVDGYGSLVPRDPPLIDPGFATNCNVHTNRSVQTEQCTTQYVLEVLQYPLQLEKNIRPSSGVGSRDPMSWVSHISMLRSSSPSKNSPTLTTHADILRGRFIESFSHRSCTQPNRRHAAPPI